jgi:hypothetical protein
MAVAEIVKKEAARQVGGRWLEGGAALKILYHS